MSGFDVQNNEQALREGVLERYEKGSQEVLIVLRSPGYEHIIKEVKSSKYLEDLIIEFQDDIDVKGQNILQVFAYGGQVKKGEDFINVSPNPTISNFLGLRK